MAIEMQEPAVVSRAVPQLNFATPRHGAWQILRRLPLLPLIIIAVFVASWLASALIYKLKGFDEIGAQAESS